MEARNQKYFPLQTPSLRKNRSFFAKRNSRNHSRSSNQPNRYPRDRTSHKECFNYYHWYCNIGKIWWIRDNWQKNQHHPHPKQKRLPKNRNKNNRSEKSLRFDYKIHLQILIETVETVELEYLVQQSQEVVKFLRWIGLTIS